MSLEDDAVVRNGPRRIDLNLYGAKFQGPNACCPGPMAMARSQIGMIDSIDPNTFSLVAAECILPGRFPGYFSHRTISVRDALKTQQSVDPDSIDPITVSDSEHQPL